VKKTRKSKKKRGKSWICVEFRTKEKGPFKRTGFPQRQIHPGGENKKGRKVRAEKKKKQSPARTGIRRQLVTERERILITDPLRKKMTHEKARMMKESKEKKPNQKVRSVGTRWGDNSERCKKRSTAPGQCSGSREGK